MVVHTIIPAHSRLKAEGSEFEASLSYLVREEKEKKRERERETLNNKEHSHMNKRNLKKRTFSVVITCLKNLETDSKR
jgi:hypothetical protein